MILEFPRTSATLRRLILAMASSLFLLAASAVPSIATLDAVSDDLLQPSTHEREMPSSAETQVLAQAAVSAPDYEIAPADLAVMVRQTNPTGLESDAERLCLARAVYFEARGEPLEGQLAVAQAIINRTQLAQYPGTICGVVAQPGQFTYRHGQAVRPGQAWEQAKAIAEIAHASLWPEVAPEAISFHAVSVRPLWRDKVRVAQIGRHVFYR
jgi:spore germination cell wall hydrolase CwlJ-like protein